MKKGVLFILILLITVSFVSASINVKNYSIKSVYYANEKLSGTVNLSVSGEPASINLTSINSQSMKFINFLKLNDANYSCSTYNCSSIFSKVEEYPSKDFSVGDSNSPVFGFYLTGPYSTLSSIVFTINSNFPESDSIPLTLHFFDPTDPGWSFNKFSTNFSRLSSSGCFDPSATLDYSRDISSLSNMYCENISLPETNSIQASAKLNGTGSAQFSMKLFNSNKQLLSSCQFSAPADNCIISPQPSISAGNYYLCISGGAQGYKIAREQSGQSCGWFGATTDTINTDNSTTDYGIYAKTPLYAKAEPVTLSTSTVTSMLNSANTYLLMTYKRDCSSGCILPVYATGVNQNITISNVSISYTSDGQLSSQSVCTISPRESIINFSGQLDLNRTNFNVGSKGNKTLQLSLGSTSIFSKSVDVQSYIDIFYVSPDNPPAGVEMEFTAEIASESNSTKFKWEWGDGQTTTTTINKAKHTYSAINAYNLTLTLTDGNNFSITKSFSIAAGSPKDLVNVTLNQKKDAINYAIQTRDSFPSWFSQKLDKLANISTIQSDINKLDSQQAMAITDSDYLTLFNKIHSLVVPYSISVGESSTEPLITDINDINPSPIAEFTGGSAENLDNYKPSINQWQRENIAAQIKKEKIICIYTDNSKVPLIDHVSVSLTSNSRDESYFVIQKPLTDITFKESSGERKSGDSTILVLPPGEQKTFEFYVIGDTAPVMYVSPKLSLLPLPTQLAPCNFNKVCEKTLGETYDNCRSDCFPVGNTIFWITILVFFALLAYIGIAYWYKTRYETHLFKDRRALYNLLMFISNARASGLSDLQISANLKKQGWSSEQVTYAIKKSHGKRTGLPEIIPFDKISAAIREKNAKQNLNKSPNQGINRW